jgi:hypothetical protein
VYETDAPVLELFASGKAQEAGPVQGVGSILSESDNVMRRYLGAKIRQNPEMAKAFRDFFIEREGRAILRALVLSDSKGARSERQKERSFRPPRPSGHPS